MWNTLGRVHTSDLANARLEAHHAVQWVARAARAYCTSQPDDSHTSTTWNPDVQALMGYPLTSDLAVGLHLNDLTLLARSARGNESYGLLGQTENAASEWIAHLVERHDLNPQLLQEPGPYTLSHHDLDSGGRYGTAGRTEREELARYYNNAAPLLEDVCRTFPQASPVRCWPHFFDIATLLSFDQTDTSDAATIGVGLSPGDATFPEPYFYVSLWPYPPHERLPSIMAPAFWHLEGFTAVVLRSQDLVSEINTDEQPSQVKAIIEDSLKKSVDLLAR